MIRKNVAFLKSRERLERQYGKHYKRALGWTVEDFILDCFCAEYLEEGWIEENPNFGMENTTVVVSDPYLDIRRDLTHHIVSIQAVYIPDMEEVRIIDSNYEHEKDEADKTV